MMPVMDNLPIDPAEDGLTCLEILRRHLPAAPKAYLRQMLSKGRVRLESRPVTAETVLRTGDRLTLPDSKRLQELVRASEKMRVVILLENPLWLAVYKPPGLAVHRGAGHEKDNLTDRVRAWLKARGAPFRVAPVHRLDVGTSGPVLFAKGRRAAGELGKSLMNGDMKKIYLALAAGSFPGELGSEVLSPEPAFPSRECVLSTSVPAKGKIKKARTRFRILSTTADFTLLQLVLLSGRTHQIRRQLADAGHPLAGDRRYGGLPLSGLERPFLHCLSLAWPDPLSKTRQQVHCPLPEDLAYVLRTIGLDLPG